MRRRLQAILTHLRDSFKFHYLWRSFFFDQIYAKLLKLSHVAEKISSRILITYIIIISILVLINGLARIITSNIFNWTEEINRWLLIGVCFFGSGIAIKKGLHVGITIFIEMLPVFLKRSFVFASNVFITIFLLCLIVISFITAIAMTQKTGITVNMVLLLPYMQIPVSSILILLQMLPFLFGPLLKDTDPENFLLTRIITEE